MSARSDSTGRAGKTGDPAGPGEASDPAARPVVDPGQLDGLVEAVAKLEREVEALAVRVAGLAEVVSRRPGPGSGGTEPDEAARERESGDPPTEIVVSPVPELALAALAETTVRGLSGVRSLYSVRRVDDSILFQVQADPDADLVAEMRQAMPVPVTVIDSREGSVSLALQWS